MENEEYMKTDENKKEGIYLNKTKIDKEEVYQNYTPIIESAMNSTGVSPMLELIGGLEMVMTTVPKRNPTQVFQYVLDFQVTEPEKIATIFKQLSKKTGNKELSEFADAYVDGYMSSPMILYGLGLLQKNMSKKDLEGIIYPTSKQNKALKIVFNNRTDPLNNNQLSYLTTVVLGDKYKEKLPFVNSENLTYEQVLGMTSQNTSTTPFLGDMLYLNSTDYTGLKEKIPEILGGKQERVQRDVTAMPVTQMRSVKA